MLDFIGFDADDTLWHNENIYLMTQERFAELLAPYHDREWIDARLLKTEEKNIRHFGYGIKAFTLSMVETAVELTEGRISGTEIKQILDFAKEMLAHPVELLPDVEQTLHQLTGTYPLLLITKGDLFDQSSKIAESGLAGLFTHIEVVSHKTPQVYADLLAKYSIVPERFLMVGNSLRSDVLPVVDIGGQGVHIPYETTWEHELVTADEAHGNGYVTLERMGELEGYLRRINN